MNRFQVCALMGALLLFAGCATAEENGIDTLRRFREVYEARFGRPQEYMVEMRDGVKLSTIVYLPRGTNDTGKYAAVLDRSPYGHFGTELLTLLFAPFDFVAVMQDLRGARKSEGKWEMWRMDGNDGYDTMQWISQQSWSNGKVFSIGFSADGNAALAGGALSPPWLKGQWIGWASGSGYKTAFQGGAWVENLLERWLTGTGFPYAIPEVLAEEVYTEEYWDPIEIETKVGVCDWPSVHWAGWYDIFQEQSIEAWQYYQDETSGCPGRATLFIDAHGHCGFFDAGDTYFPLSRLPLPILQAIELFIQENGNTEKLELLKRFRPEDADALTFYVMGSGEDATYGNYWTTLPDFPRYNATSYYLHADGSLSLSSQRTPASLSYTYDPSDPVPSNGGNNLLIPCGQFDQRENEARDDVLTFTTAPLTGPLSFTGKVTAVLYVESTANDTDFTVMITDVYPDGRSMLLQDGIQRMRWRNSNKVPSYMERGTVYEITVDLWYTSYIMEPGHSLRVAVSSSNSPRFHTNLNNGLLVEDEEQLPPVVAVNTLHLSSTYPSRLVLPIVDMADIPNNYLNRPMPTFEEFLKVTTGLDF